MSKEDVVARIGVSLSGHLGAKASHIAEAIATYVDATAFVSNPPSGCYKIYNIYLTKTNGVYNITVDHEAEPEP